MDVLFAKDSSKQIIELSANTIKDIALNELIDHLGGDPDERAIIKKIMSQIPTNPNDMIFRQNILKDLIENEDLCTSLGDILAQIKTLKLFGGVCKAANERDTSLYTPKTIQHEEEYYEEIPVNTVTPVTETSKKKPSKAVDAALIMTGIATGGALMPLVAGGIIANHSKARNTETKYLNETKIEKVKKKRTISENNPEYYELKRQLSELTDSINNTKSQYLSGEMFLKGIYNNSDKPFTHVGDDGYNYSLILENVGNDEDSVMDLLIKEFSISYRQAISIIDDLPHKLKGSYSKADCDRIVNALRDAGATVSIVQTK